ncbi:50S ribosomal protein L31 [Candidatus Ishikawella capsulata]|uniref:Large ribosomal subunit protein bL31 n=1 Tax=Candidatus Ishikawaella capsulata Mpkobe TaxID=476281 RepID=C5WDM9_9ENTR|nr:50S ribosomal protein L31 [Candidatus Ishikawaella capsulata]BAH83435.1 50S ribosomal subunit protein L31 [Candidatus Ishikawaella capsulata Mpkobe]
MKKTNIHPTYQNVTIACSCGNIINTRSTLKHKIILDVCGKCHPFYTRKQRIVDTGGRVELFNKRFKIQGSKEK